MCAWDQYEIVGVLGRGKYGTVSRARHKRLGSIVALKSVFDLNEDSLKDGAGSNRGTYNVRDFGKEKALLYHEARLLATLDHPCLVSIIEICVGVDGMLVLAMEDLGGMSLTGLVQAKSKYNGGLCESLVGSVANHIASGLLYLHEQGLLHRDVKPDNIMVETCCTCFPRAKLIDLGLSIAYTTENLPNSSNTRAGTLAFMAPELMSPDTNYDSQVDVFGLGCSLYFALSGNEPFMCYTTKSGQRSTTAVFGLQLDHQDQLDSMSSDVNIAVRSMLATDPSSRSRIPDLLRTRWLQCSAVGSSYSENVEKALPMLDKWLSLMQHNSTLALACRSCLRKSSTSSFSSSIEDTSSLDFQKLSSSSISERDDDVSKSDVLSVISDTSEIRSKSNELKLTCEKRGRMINGTYFNETVATSSVCKVLGVKNASCVSAREDSNECTCPLPKARDDETVNKVAKILGQSISSVISHIEEYPWGKVAGVYNLVKLKDHRSFAPVESLDSVIWQSNSNSRKLTD